MEREQIEIRTSSPSAAPRRPKSRRGLWIGASMATAVAAIALSVVFLIPKAPPSGPPSASRTPPTKRQPIEAVAANPKLTPTVVAVHEEIIDDSKGELLWASPTQGPPLSLAYVPAGTQCLIHLRPALINGTDEGRR